MTGKDQGPIVVQLDENALRNLPDNKLAALEALLNSVASGAGIDQITAANQNTEEEKEARPASANRYAQTLR